MIRALLVAALAAHIAWDVCRLWVWLADQASDAMVTRVG